MYALTWGLARHAAARALVQRARTWSGDADWHRRLELLELRIEGLEGDFTSAYARTGRILAQPGLDPAALRTTEGLRAIAALFTGHVREAHELAWRNRPRLPFRDQTELYALGTLVLASCESGIGWATLDAYLRDVLRDAVRTGHDGPAGLAALALAQLSFQEGRYHDASRWLAESELHLERENSLGGETSLWSIRIGVAWMTGEPQQVQPALDALRRTLRGREPHVTERLDIARADGWEVRVRLGAEASAEHFLTQAAAQADVPLFAGLLAYEALRAGATSAAAALLADAGLRCDAPLLAAGASHAEARLSASGAALLEVAGTFEGMGALRYALEAATDAASAFLEEGREDSARRAAARARDLHVLEQGTVAPTIGDLGGRTLALMPREAQVAELVARGLSNAEIAQRLVLSIRTVEAHVYRGMSKRGVASRAEL